jgi:hypothetical protein
MCNLMSFSRQVLLTVPYNRCSHMFLSVATVSHKRMQSAAVRTQTIPKQVRSPRRHSSQRIIVEAFMSVQKVSQEQMRFVDRSEIEVDYDARSKRCTVVSSTTRDLEGHATSNLQGYRVIHCVVLVKSSKKRSTKSRCSRRHDDGTPSGRSGRGRSCHGRRSSRQPQHQS